MTPRVSYLELSIGDELGRDQRPECCEAGMAARDLDNGRIEYTCRDCGTVLEVDALGLISDIRD
ncbi:hypothetical protein ACFY1P_20120 [Streptomyces sp. NPDC001407]|uniref:hypothetical protein n=1 Tax=Streptomyces sp. NPDC001407 TaxID=3364573 RepID=UPI0036BB3821